MFMFMFIFVVADAAVSYVDEHVGALLNVLEKHDIVDDTIVIFHADHGTSCQRTS